MKRDGITNSQLMWLLTRMRHGDRIVMADCGLLIPSQILRIGLALIKGVPPFQQGVQALKEETVFQKLIVTQEIRAFNSTQSAFLKAIFSDVVMEEVPHEMLKKMLPDVLGVIRTGEATPYANVILEGG
ncbi:MAG: D-ribose pyranase [Candidatus Verstraetearchaeota archaeon]|nr:D-ribose pyranase [Candidatus Verstraetearchaeota archaeon]